MNLLDNAIKFSPQNGTITMFLDVYKRQLSYDGDVSISQSNVHYLYSGFTSKWKPYSSPKAPTEQIGRAHV